MIVNRNAQTCSVRRVGIVRKRHFRLTWCDPNRNAGLPIWRLHAELPSLPPVGVVRERNIPRGKDNLPRIRQSLESGAAWQPNHRKSSDIPFAPQAKLRKLGFSRRWRIVVPFASLNLQNALYLKFPRANTVCLVPVHFDMAYPTIGQLHGCDSLEFSPALASIDFLQPATLANALAGCNRFDVRDAANNLEKHT